MKKLRAAMQGLSTLFFFGRPSTRSEILDEITEFIRKEIAPNMEKINYDEPRIMTVWRVGRSDEHQAVALEFGYRIAHYH